MKYSLIIFFFFVFGNCFSQDLEEAIYVATETFNADRNPKTYSVLLKNEASFKSKLSTKDDYFAYLFLLVNKANYLEKTNQQTKAIATYETALNLYNKQKLDKTFVYDITEFCLKPLGILYNQIGDYTNAENTIKHYIFLAEQQKNIPHKISGSINLARLYFTIGKYKSAKDVANNGLEIKGATDLQKQMLKRIITDSTIKGASSKSNSTNPIVLETNSDNDINYQLALKNKDYKKALAFFKLKYSQLNTEGLTARDQAKLKVEHAQILYKLNDFNNALMLLKQALNILLPNYNLKVLPEKEDLYPENTFIDIFDLLARLQTNPNNTLACYDLSFYVSNLLTQNITSQEAKLIHLSANRNRSELCINLLFDTYQATKDTTTIIKAFDYAEKNKASILKETIGKKTLFQLHPNDSLLIKEQSYLLKQERLTNDLIKAQYQQNANQIDLISQDLTNVSVTLKQLKSKINKRYPDVDNTSIDFTRLQQKLKKDEAILVEYFYGVNNVFQFTISDTGFDLIRIEKNTLFDSSIANYIDYFNNSSVINNNIQQFTTDALLLYKLLQFDKTATYKNVVVITDGFLNFIPFESLLTQNTTTKSYSKMPFVAKNQALAYNTSALFYLNNRPFKYSNTVLGVFPVFDNSNSKLTYSLNEAESIDKATNAKFLMYDSATKNDALQQAKNYSVLHLSTHATSGSFTVPANIDFIDQKLFLNELYSLNLNNNLVVLSACETGIGKLQKGEGSMNLARGFQYAGVENLLFSLWKINDLSTSQLMALFYKNYSKTESAFKANHLSKVDYLEDNSISNIKKSPYYWSAFIYYGDLTPEKPSNFLKSILFTFIGLGIALLLILIIRRRKNGQHA